MRGHDTEDLPRRIWPTRLASLSNLLLVGCGTLWAVFGIQSTWVMMLVQRVPEVKLSYSHSLAWITATFFLSGVVTMLLSRRWLRPARGLATVLKRVVVLASGCYLLGFFAPMTAGFLLFREDMTGWLNLHGLVRHGVLWLSWIAGGLAVSLLDGLGRRRG